MVRPEPSVRELLELASLATGAAGAALVLDPDDGGAGITITPGLPAEALEPWLRRAPLPADVAVADLQDAAAELRPPAALPVRALASVAVEREAGRRGLLLALDGAPKVWPPSALAALRTCAGAVARTLDAAARQADAELRARVAAAVSAATAAAGPLSETLQRCAEALHRELGAAFVRIWTHERESSTLVLATSFGAYTHIDGAHARVPVGALKIGRIAQERRPHLTNDVQNDAWISDPEWARREGMVAFAGHPLCVGDRLVGVLALFSRAPLSAAALEALEVVAHTIALTIERARAYEAERAQARAVDAMHRIGAALMSELDMSKIVERLTEEARRVTRAEFAAFFYNVVRPTGEAYTLYSLAGVPREAFAAFPMPRNTAIFEPTFSGRGVVRFDDVTKAPGYGENAPYHGMPPGHLPVRSYLAVPVVSRTREVLGGLFFGHSRAGVFGPEEERLLVAVAAQAAVAIENARLYEQVKQSEVRARGLAEGLREGLLAVDTTGIVNFANPSALRLLGRSVDDLLGHDVSWALWREPGRDVEPLHRALRERTVARRELDVLGADGALPVACVVAPLVDDDRVTGAAITLQDLRERRRYETFIEGHTRVLEAIARDEPLPVTLELLCRTLDDYLEGSTSSFLLLEDGRLRDCAAPGLPRAYRDAIDGIAIGPDVGSCGTAAFRRRQVIVSDVATDPLWTAFRAVALPHGLRAAWSYPMIATGGEVVGTYALYHDTPKAPSDAEQRLAGLVTRTATIALERARAAAQRRALVSELEHERARFELALKQMPSGMLLVDAEGQIVLMNEQATALLGRRLTGELQAIEGEYRVYASDGTLRPAAEWPLSRAQRGETVVDDEVEVQLPTGARAVFRVSAAPVRDGQGRIVSAMATFQDVTERRRAEDERRALLASERAARAQAEADRTRLQAQYGVTSLLAASTDLGEVAAEVMRSVAEPLGWDVGALWVTDEADEALRLAGAWTRGVEWAPFVERCRMIAFRAGEGALGRVWQTGAPLLGDVEQGMLVPARTEAAGGLRACAWFPVRVGERVRAVLELFRSSAEPCDDDTARALTALAGQVGQFAERIEAEEARRVSEEWFSTTLRSIGDGVIATDARGRVTFMNHVAEELTGWSDRDAHGRPLRDVFKIVNEYTRADVESPVDKVIREGVIVGLANHTILIARDGTERPIDDSGAPIRDPRDPHGALAGVVLVFRDVSAARAHERERQLLADATAALGRSLDLRRTLAEVVQLAVPSFADWCAIELFEQGRPRALAFAHRDPARQTAADTLHRLPDGLCGALGLGGEADAGRAIGDQEVAPEARALVAALAGAPRVAAPIAGRTQRGYVIFGAACAERAQRCGERLVDELARRVELAIENARLLRDAEDANQAKDHFLATISHELRTPLNAVLGWARLLRMGAVDGEAEERALETIERNAQAQARLIDDLLDVSRIISGRLRLELSRVDVSATVAAAVDGVRPAAQAKDIALCVEGDESARWLVGDPTRLQQVFWNLLSNAVKFTPKGGQIVVRVARVESRLEVTVSDDGIGIAADFMPQLFQRFRQADAGKRGPRGGLGLGLAIVRHLVELHGGTVRAESEGEGKGARFIVSLPVRAAQELEPEARDGGSVPGVPRLDGAHVLVVEDEPDARELVRVVVGRSGARVTAVSCVADAFDVIERDRPDVIVSDIGLPDEDGYAFLRRLRTRSAQEGGAVPAVALTAFARTEDRTKALMAGFQSHVPKPVDAAELLVVLANLLGRLRATGC